MQDNDLKISELELRRERPELFTNKPLPDGEPRDGSYTRANLLPRKTRRQKGKVQRAARRRQRKHG